MTGRYPRIDGWDAAFQALLDEWAARPFEYGKSDCACWAAAAVLALTGQDFYAPFRGRYRSAAGSVRALRLYGAGDLPATLTAALGAPVHRAFAGRGDVVRVSAESLAAGPWIDPRGGKLVDYLAMDGAVGVCTGREALLFTEDGIEALPMDCIQQAWKV